MPTLTYCTHADVEAAWTAAAVLAAVDDDGDSAISESEAAIITRAIERAANRLNAAIGMRYPLAALVANEWCRDCNALLAAYLLATRRGAAAPDQLQEQYEAFIADLEDIVALRKCVPQVPVLTELAPTVTNFRVDPQQSAATIRRVAETSTGNSPAPSVQSYS